MTLTLNMGFFTHDTCFISIFIMLRTSHYINPNLSFEHDC